MVNMKNLPHASNTFLSILWYVTSKISWGFKLSQRLWYVSKMVVLLWSLTSIAVGVKIHLGGDTIICSSFPASRRMEVTDVPLIACRWFHFLLDLKMTLYTNWELGEIHVANRASGNITETRQDGNRDHSSHEDTCTNINGWRCLRCIFIKLMWFIAVVC